MRRRALLAATAASALAGCLADDGSEDDDSQDDGSADDPNGDGQSGSPDETGDPSPSVTDQSVETTATDCAGGDVGSATVERDAEGVTVTGSMETPTPCYVATLKDVSIEDGRLTVVVDVEEEDGICVECVGVVEYEARVDVEYVDSVSGVTVEHVDGDTYTEE